MSWLFAVSGTHTSESYCRATADWTVSTDKLYLAVGGNPDTSIWGSNPEDSSGWAVLGISISRFVASAGRRSFKWFGFPTVYHSG